MILTFLIYFTLTFLPSYIFNIYLELDPIVFLKIFVFFR